MDSLSVCGMQNSSNRSESWLPLARDYILREKMNWNHARKAGSLSKINETFSIFYLNLFYPFKAKESPCELHSSDLRAGQLGDLLRWKTQNLKEREGETEPRVVRSHISGNVLGPTDTTQPKPWPTFGASIARLTPLTPLPPPTLPHSLSLQPSYGHVAF